MKEAATVTPAPHLPPPAPGADRYLALDFANSVLTAPSGEYDLLGTPEDATAWLVERELAPPDGRLYEPCAGRLRALRGPVRALLASRIDSLAAPWQALSAVNAALSGAPSAALLGWDEERGLHRTPAHPSDAILAHALAVLAADAADLLTGPDAERLAACGSPPCTRFLLRTHGARHWCSVRCGDRVRAARAYAKRVQAKADRKAADQA